MELNKMIGPSSHKTSFDIRLPHDTKRKYNEFIKRDIPRPLSNKYNH